jgi:hypothetical protein
VTRAAAAQADRRWAHERLFEALSSWEGFWGLVQAARPSLWGAVMLFMIGLFVKTMVEQFAQGYAAERDRQRILAEVKHLLKQQ